MYDGVSSYANQVDAAFMFIFISCLVLLAIVTVFMIYCLVRYSKHKNPKPANIDGHVGLEVLWTVLPTILVLGMFVYGKNGFDAMRTLPPENDPNTVYVDVNAYSWYWDFHYDNGKKARNEFYVPVGRPVVCRLDAKGSGEPGAPGYTRPVLHSFFIPAFRIKEDVVPSGNNVMWFQADKEGTYDILCAEYCGTQHSAMLGKVHVVDEETFEEYYNTPNKVEITPETGQQHYKNLCMACHSIDGSRMVGPTFKGIYNRKEIVIEDGVEKEIVANDEYILHSIRKPASQIVKGYPNGMVPYGEDQLSDDDVKAIIEYMKTLE